MNHVEFSSPAPSCPIQLTHPARAYIPVNNTDVARTFAEHRLDDIEAEKDDEDGI